MIKGLRILLIYSGDEAHEMARKMKQTIINSNDPIIVTIVDNDYIGPTANDLSERIFTALDEADYAIVFFTKSLQLHNPNENEETSLFTARPNLWLELGYLRRKISPKYIQYVTNFEYKCIDEGTYLIASDIPQAQFHEVTDTNTIDNIWNIFSAQLIEENLLPRRQKENASNLLFNKNYKTNYSKMFTQTELDSIEDIHPERQYYTLWDQLLKKHKDFSIALNSGNSNTYPIEQWHILYLFERLIFLVLFPKSLLGSISDFSVEPNHHHESLTKYISIYNAVLYYIDPKKKTYTDYEILYNTITKNREKMNKVAPIVDIISKNYIGLCRLQQVLKALNRNDISRETLNKYLDEAEKCFEYVQNISGMNSINQDAESTSLGDPLSIFNNFASYNLARVLVLQGRYHDAKDQFEKAIEDREALSQYSRFPKVINLYFLSELYHAKLDYFKLILEHKELNSKIDQDEIPQMEQQINNISQTVQFSVPLFQSVLKQLESLKMELNNINKEI